MDMRRRRKMKRMAWLVRLMPVIGLWVLASCAAPKKEMPAGVLTQPQLTSFLIEMYVAEAHLEARSMPKDSAIKIFIPYEEKLKSKFAISDSTLKKTYAYYLENPKDLEAVYDALIDSLSLKEQKTVKD